MALYSKEIKRAQDKAKSGKSTKITTKKAEKTPKLRGAYEVASTISKPKKKKVETKTVKKKTEKPMGLGPDDKAYGALPKKKRTGKPLGFSAEAVRQGKKQRNRFKDKVDLTNVPKKRTAQPFGPGTKDEEQAGRTRKGEPKVTKKRLSDPSYNPMGIKGAKLKKYARKIPRRPTVIKNQTSVQSPTSVAKLKVPPQENRYKYEEPDATKESRLTSDELRKKRIKEAAGKRKGGTVSRKAGGTVWNGNSEVSRFYD
jgi:hypothetical protein